MSRFVGFYHRDFTGMTVGGHVVETHVGRDPSGSYRWRISCKRCGWEQIIPHAKLAALADSPQATLQCANSACPQSRQHHDDVTLSELRRQERREAEKTAEAQRAAQEQAAQHRAQLLREQAKLAPLREQYRKYAHHAMTSWNRDVSELPGFAKWCTFSESDRARIMAQIEKEKK